MLGHPNLIVDPNSKKLVEPNSAKLMHKILHELNLAEQVLRILLKSHLVEPLVKYRVSYHQYCPIGIKQAWSNQYAFYYGKCTIDSQTYYHDNLFYKTANQHGNRRSHVSIVKIVGGYH